MRPEMEEDERSKKNTFLKIDFFFFTPRGRLTGRQVGFGLKEEGRLFQTQKQMKEVFWQNRQSDGETHMFSNKHKPVLAEKMQSLQ